MASTDAQNAKDRGNSSFKAGDFATAVGHYTSAILADQKEPIFPLNRAAAYLKLGKNEDAVRDCNTALRLSPGHVKALFRRAQACIELARLDEAERDLSEALKAEPNNSSVKAELSRIEELKSKAKPKSKLRQSSTNNGAFRRRVPIEIVYSEQEQNVSTSIGNVTSSPKNATPIVNAESAALPKQVSVDKIEISATSKHLDALAGEISAPTPIPKSKPKSTMKVGGGIFRTSGNHTIIHSTSPEEKEQVESNSKESLKVSESSNLNLNTSWVDVPLSSATNSKPIITLFNFSRTWENLSSSMDRWKLLSQIPASSLPTFFQTSLETPLLISIIETLADVIIQNTDPDFGSENRAKIRAYMLWFPKVPRFQIAHMFMSEEEKETAKSVCDAVGVDWNL